MSTVDSQLLHPGLRVWIPNPLPEVKDDPSSRDFGTYRSGWLRTDLCGRPIWVPGVVVAVETREGRQLVRAKTSLVKPEQTVLVAAEDALPINRTTNIDDMAEFFHLHEAALLYNTLVRFHKDIIYTLAGPVLIALNPYKVVTDRDGVSIYDPTIMRAYMNRLPSRQRDAAPAKRASRLRPHVFSVADDAYSQMREQGTNQSVVISGESGAGKTETTKLIMQFLANVSSAVRGVKAPRKPLSKRRRGSIGSSTNPLDTRHMDRVERQILMSNPVLEAFGNAKTVRNSNSSRFGKYIRIIFASDGGVAGSAVDTFLLEKSRVTSHSPSERAYHIFYQLLRGASPDMREALMLRDVAYYKYLGGGVGGASAGGASLGAKSTISGVDDAADFATLQQSLSDLGVGPEAQDGLFRALSAVLRLGNLTFIGEDSASVASGSSVDLAATARLLGVDVDALVAALCTTRITAGNDATVSHLRPDQASATRDALAKAIYAGLFSWIVHAVNEALGAAAAVADEGRSLRQSVAEDRSFIGILDIFGFEVFETNSFEQLLINYANEKLQQIFTTFVFKLEAQLYESEGIDYSQIDFEDNQPAIDLIERKHLGILSMLEEACLYPRGSDKAFLQKMVGCHKRNPNFDTPPVHAPRSATSFIVRHSASDVTYDSVGFLEKNRDRVAAGAAAVMTQSTIAQVAAAFSTDGAAVAPGRAAGRASGPGGAKAGGGRARGGLVGSNAFLGSKFKDDMGRLSRTLQATEPHFVRCVKPNSAKRAGFFDPGEVHHQLRYLGVLDSIRVRHSGFSYRTTYDDFYARFVIIVPQSSRLVFPPPSHTPLRRLCMELLDELWDLCNFDAADKATEAQFGTTKIFLRQHLIQSLEALREFRLQHMDRAAVKLQSTWRMFADRRTVRRALSGFLRLQAAWRAIYYARLWRRRKRAIVAIQTATKGWLTRRWYGRVLAATLRLQGYFRRQVHRLEWLRVRRGMRLLFSLSRGFMVRMHVLRMIRAVRMLQRVARGFLVRNRLYWAKVRACLLVQQLWRGYVWRMHHPEVRAWLASKREERAERRAADTVGAAYRAHLVRRRFRALASAARVLQAALRTRSAAARFQRQRAAARTLQRVGRGFLGRARVRRMHTLNMVADEMWRVKTVRERETMQLANLHRAFDTREVAMATATTAATTSTGGSKASGIVLSRLIDVDVRIDLTDVYPDGWTHALLELPAADAGQHAAAAEAVERYAAQQRVARQPLDPAAARRAAQAALKRYRRDRRQRVGNPREEAEARARAAAPAHALLREVAVGAAHSVAVTDEGVVLTWGWGDKGQLGHGDEEAEERPRVVAGLLFDAEAAATGPEAAVAARPRLPIAHVACGEDHSVALSESGVVFAWGAGPHGELGLGPGVARTNRPQPVSGLRRRAVEVACGARHTVALTASGTVYTWGAGRQAGHGVFVGDGDHWAPSCVRALARLRVRRVAAGADFSLAVTHGGEVFSWGENACGQLGHGDTRARLVPTAIARLQSGRGATRVSSVACGARHAVGVTSTGRLLAWGDNRHGQLGHGDTEPRLVPATVSRLRTRIVYQAACGARHTVALADQREVFAWGHTQAVAAASRRQPHSVAEAGGGADRAATDADATQFETPVPLAVPLSQVPGRVPVGVFASHSRMLSATGVRFVQHPVNDFAFTAAAVAHAARGGGGGDGGAEGSPDGAARAAAAHATAVATDEAEALLSASLDPAADVASTRRASAALLSVGGSSLSTAISQELVRELANVDPVRLQTMSAQELRELVARLQRRAVSRLTARAKRPAAAGAGGARGAGPGGSGGGRHTGVDDGDEVSGARARLGGGRAALSKTAAAMPSATAPKGSARRRMRRMSMEAAMRTELLQFDAPFDAPRHTPIKTGGRHPAASATAMLEDMSAALRAPPVDGSSPRGGRAGASRRENGHHGPETSPVGNGRQAGTMAQQQRSVDVASFFSPEQLVPRTRATDVDASGVSPVVAAAAARQRAQTAYVERPDPLEVSAVPTARMGRSRRRAPQPSAPARMGATLSARAQAMSMVDVSDLPGSPPPPPPQSARPAPGGGASPPPPAPASPRRGQWASRAVPAGQPQPGTPRSAGRGDAASEEQSMDDILASIKQRAAAEFDSLYPARA